MIEWDWIDYSIQPLTSPNLDLHTTLEKGYNLSIKFLKVEFISVHRVDSPYYAISAHSKERFTVKKLIFLLTLTLAIAMFSITGTRHR